MATPQPFADTLPRHGRITIDSLEPADIVILHSVLSAIQRGYNYITWFDICNTARHERVSIEHELLNHAIEKYLRIGVLRRSDKPPVYWIARHSFIGN